LTLQGKHLTHVPKVLLTGGAGYIASHTAKRLFDNGFEPVTLDNLCSGHRWAVKWGPFIQGDIADHDLVCEIVRQYGIEAVLHFAAHASVAESMLEPRKYFKNNLANTLGLIDALLDCGVKRIIFSSSCATYGIPESVPISEEHRQNPVNPYGESKLMIERVLRWYQDAYGMSSVSLRYFNAAGADPEGEIGEEHDPETHLIPLAAGAVLGSHDAVHVYGADYPTRDGTAIRDYTHVNDIADAHAMALHYLLDGSPSIALNLGTGRGHSVLEVLGTMEKVSRRRVPVIYCKRRPGDPTELVANPSKAAEVLGWRPAFTDLKDIVATAWQWHSTSQYSQTKPRRTG
jgi:UDP-arabinose 4-epimerase